MVLDARAADARTIRIEVTDGVVIGDRSRGEGQEVSPVGKEDHHREGVAEQKLADGGKPKKDTAKPDVDCCSCYRGPARTLPSH